MTMNSATSLASLTNTRTTDQTLPAGNSPVPQVKNNAGGFVFEITPEQQLDRFLILGTLGGTFYQKEQDLLSQNLSAIKDLIATKGKYVVDRTAEISKAGRARNNDYALLVLALCFAHGNNETKALAQVALSIVARTGTHLLHFVNFVDGMRGWGRGLKKAVASWYNNKTADQVAFQVAKYPQRDGWSHVDVLRLSHPKAPSNAHTAVYNYLTQFHKTGNVSTDIPAILVAVEQAKTADTPALVRLIQDHGLTFEMIPTEKRNEPAVWEALLPTMGATALLRNLNKMTAIGLIAPFSDATRFVTERMNDVEYLSRNRLHPLQILVGKKVYGSGYGIIGSLSWNPVGGVVEALESAFYSSFDVVEPSGKNHLLAIDVSGSMNSPCSGSSLVSCREAAAIMAMVTAKREPWCEIYGFDHAFRSLDIRPSDSLETVCQKTYSCRFGSTDCSLPMVVAAQNNWNVDTFSVYTDNETYAGKIHPFQALQQFRSKMNKPDAKLAVVAMTSSRFSIANPKDPGMLDLVGFDTATPAILSDFSAGRI